MSAALEMVRIALQAYGSGDPEIALELCDPLVRWDERSARAEGDLIWKRENVESAMRRFLTSWKEYRLDVEKLREYSPGRVVGLVREVGIDAAGAHVDRRYGGLWVVDRLQIISWSLYLAPKEAVRAARELGEGAEPMAPIPVVADVQPAPAPAQAVADAQPMAQTPADAQPKAPGPAPHDPVAPKAHKPISPDEIAKRRAAARRRALAQRRAAQGRSRKSA